jgi:hypothetical protein
MNSSRPSGARPIFIFAIQALRGLPSACTWLPSLRASGADLTSCVLTQYEFTATTNALTFWWRSHNLRGHLLWLCRFFSVLFSPVGQSK